jgi:hypothetical protein
MRKQTRPLADLGRMVTCPLDVIRILTTLFERQRIEIPDVKNMSRT